MRGKANKLRTLLATDCNRNGQMTILRFREEFYREKYDDIHYLISYSFRLQSQGEKEFQIFSHLILTGPERQS